MDDGDEGDGFKDVGMLAVRGPVACDGGTHDEFPDTAAFEPGCAAYRPAATNDQVRIPSVPTAAALMAEAWLEAGEADASWGDEAGVPMPTHLVASGGAAHCSDVAVECMRVQSSLVVDGPAAREDGKGLMVAAFAHLFDRSGSAPVAAEAQGDNDGGGGGDASRAGGACAAPVGEESGLDPGHHLATPTTPELGIAAARDAAAARALLPPALQLMFRDGMAAVLAGMSSPVTVASCEVEAPAPTDGSGCDADATALRIAVAQVHSTSGDVWANVNKVSAVVGAVSGHGDLVVFPETFLTGYHVGHAALRALAVPVPPDEVLSRGVAAVLKERAAAGGEGAWSPTTPGTQGHPLVAIAAIAALHRVATVISFAEAGDVGSDDANPAPSYPPIYNAVAVFDADGSLVSLYRKTHLWGCAYEKAVFTRGPGPAHPRLHGGRVATDGGGSSGGAARHVWDPYHPFTLRAFPSTPMGTLVCFDNEFPEAARALAVRGAKVIVAVMASGERVGFTSRKIVPTRAAENHVCMVYCNYPSAPLPEEVEEESEEAHDKGAGGAWPQRVVPMGLAASDGIRVAYSGGSTVCAPTGDAMVSLPVYPCSPHRAPRDGVTFTTGDDACFDARGTAAVHAHLSATVTRMPWSGRQAGSDGTALALPALGSVMLPGCTDACVIIARYQPRHPAYLRDEERNPYLADRRIDLYPAVNLSHVKAAHGDRGRWE